jgi:transposase InsO family protein
VAENVLGQDFGAKRPDRKWVADITYVPTKQGWLYVAAVMDLCSRKIVGWAMAEHLRAELCLEALGMALAARKPTGKLVHHSDRGCQYACAAYRDLLEGEGITCSMSRAGNCYDNAAMESFWATLKTELTHHESYATLAEARGSVFEFVECWYNRKRRHSALGNVSPEAYEARFN